jgi:hypothetical protein
MACEAAMSDSLARIRQHWRLYAVVFTLMVGLAAIVHLLAGFPLVVSRLVVLLGCFANGILILLGERPDRGRTGSGRQN